MKVRALLAAAAAVVVLVVAAPASAATFTGQQKAVLYGIARDTWRFYGSDVDPSTHLPLDTLGPVPSAAPTPRRPTSAYTCGRSSLPTTSG
jgi:hypothetical protein